MASKALGRSTGRSVCMFMLISRTMGTQKQQWSRKSGQRMPVCFPFLDCNGTGCIPLEPDHYSRHALPRHRHYC